jgi:hypothetical protein
LAVGVAGGADDEVDVGLIETAERLVKVDGDAGGDAGRRPWACVRTPSVVSPCVLGVSNWYRQ